MQGKQNCFNVNCAITKKQSAYLVHVPSLGGPTVIINCMRGKHTENHCFKMFSCETNNLSRGTPTGKS